MAEEKQVFSLCSLSLCSPVMQARLWKRGAGWNQLEAGLCLVAAPLFLECLRPAFPREYVPSLAGMLCFLGITQATPFIAEERKIFPAQLLMGLVRGFPSIFPGCTPQEGVPLSPALPVMSPGLKVACPRVLPFLQEQEDSAGAADLSGLSQFYSQAMMLPTPQTPCFGLFLFSE